MVDSKISKLKIIIGRHGSGKSDWLYNRFIDMAWNNENKKIDLNKKLYLIVPEQYTNDKQRKICQMIEERELAHGILNIDILSFDRIAMNIFDRLGIDVNDEVFIDDSAKTMVLSLILSQLDNKLKYYNKMTKNYGFATKMTKAMSELYAYDVSNNFDEKIQNVIDDIKINNKNLSLKIEDLKQIYFEFKRKLKDLGVSIKEDIYDKLNNIILNDNEYFNNSIVAFEGFTGFTPVQLEIFKKILKESKEVYVVIDYRDDNNINDYNSICENFNRINDKTNLFYLSEKYIYDVKKAYEEVYDIKININDFICNYNPKNILYKYADKDKEDLYFLESNLYNYKSTSKFNGNVRNIEIFETKNVKEEIINISHYILNNIKINDKLKFNDIRIIVPNIDDYKDKIIPIFDKYNIPYFIDNSKSILNSPYIEVIRSAIDVIYSDFSYDSIMRYLSSGLFKKDDTIYEIDNFIREYGIRGRNRFEKGFEQIINYKLDEIEKEIDAANKNKPNIIDDKIKNNYIDNLNLKFINSKEYYKKILNAKNKIINPLIDFYDEVINKKNINIYINALLNFTKKIDLDSIFNKFILSVNVNDNNQIELLKKSVEVKDDVINIINKIFNNYDRNDITFFEFKTLIDIGFSDYKVKILPTKIDQVIIGDLMRTRFDNPKILICLGFNNSKVPSQNFDNNLIDDNMRNAFENANMELSQTTFETTLNQRMYIYLALTNPTEKLVLSYPRLNVNGTSDEKSSVIKSIENLFDNDLDICKKCDKYTFGFYNIDDIVDYVTENIKDIKFEQNYNTDNSLYFKIYYTKKLLKFLHKNYNIKFKELCENIFNKVDKKKDFNLNEDIIKYLTGFENEINISASYLELYKSCPFKFYLEKIIELKERKNYEVSSMDVGIYLHKILEKIYSLYSYKEIEEFIKNNEIDQIIISKINEAIEDNFGFKDLCDGDIKYFGYYKLLIIKNICLKLIKSSILFLNYLQKKSNFNRIITEKKFSNSINISNTKIIINGRIDKLEIKEDKDKIYINIIDYKSGKNSNKLKYSEIIDGYKIQLALYLDYVKNDMKLNKKIIPCGAFYFRIDNPIISINSYEEIESVNNKIIDELSYVGIANKDLSVLKNINNSFSYFNNKYVMDEKTGFKIDGNFIIDNDNKDDEFDNMINLIHEKLYNEINLIKKGVININPYDKSKCKFCKYLNYCNLEFQDDE